MLTCVVVTPTPLWSVVGYVCNGSALHSGASKPPGRLPGNFFHHIGDFHWVNDLVVLFTDCIVAAAGASIPRHPQISTILWLLGDWRDDVGQLCFM